MEIWDGYRIDGTLTCVELIRGEPIPDGFFHLACEVLVRHTDGDYLLMQRSYEKEAYPGYYEATAGGAALKGENRLDCIKRELFEETGIASDDFQEFARYTFTDDKCLFYCFLCTTDCDKDKIILQDGETISFKWVNEKEFIDFVNSDNMIASQKRRYRKWLKDKKYI
jgi:isopentenyldiphosphate isomerase